MLLLQNLPKSNKSNLHLPCLLNLHLLCLPCLPCLPLPLPTPNLSKFNKSNLHLIPPNILNALTQKKGIYQS